MNIFISHDTACAFWRTATTDEVARMKKVHAVPSGLTAMNPRSARVMVEGTRLAQRVIHSSLPVSHKTTSSSAEIFHTASNLPAGYYWKYKRDVYIASPELTFVQMASRISLQECVLLGMDLCSTYTRDEFLDDGLDKRPALTTPAKLMAAADVLHKQHGAAAAKKAAQYVLANTASPMESLVAAQLYLPFAYGWSGLPKPECNYQIDVPPALRDLTQSPFYKADLCWPDYKVALEYQSDFWHQGQGKIAEDARRVNILQALGYQVILATSDQVMKPSELDKVAVELAKAMKLRQRKSASAHAEQREKSAPAMNDWTFKNPWKYPTK